MSVLKATGLHRKLFRDLNTLRSQVITIGILILGGISVLVSSWSSYQSLQTSRDTFYEKYQFADVFAEVVRAPDSLSYKISRIPGVQLVESRVITEGLVEIERQAEPALGRFISWKGFDQAINLIHLRQGRMPQKSSQPQYLIEVVVHEAFAVAHHLKMGDTLKVLLHGQQKKLLITGVGLSPEYVYALSPIAPLPDDKHFGIFWARHEDLAAITGLNDSFNSLQIKANRDASLNEIKQELDQILQPFGHIQSYDRSKQISHQFVDSEIHEQKVMATVVPSIFLAVAVFMLNIILSRLITLHRPQIATLKAIGYPAWVLTLHYFQLVTLILVLGIIPAILAGAWIGHWYAGLYADFFRFPSIDFSLSISSVLLGITAGLVPGWFGALAALSRVFLLQPAEALRPQTPPHFQKSFFDKFGWIKNLNPFSKIIIRAFLFQDYKLQIK